MRKIVLAFTFLFAGFSHGGNLPFGANYVPAYVEGFRDTEPALAFLLALDRGTTYRRYTDAYDPNKVYYGIWDSDKCYRYNADAGYFEVSTCDCHRNDERGYISKREICFKGNYLNWMTGTKADMTLKTLVGGYYKAEIDSVYISVTTTLGGSTYIWVRDHEYGCHYRIKVPRGLPYEKDKKIQSIIGNCRLKERYANPSDIQLALKIPKTYGGVLQDLFKQNKKIYVIIPNYYYSYPEVVYWPDQRDLTKLIEAVGNLKFPSRLKYRDFIQGTLDNRLFDHTTVKDSAKNPRLKWVYTDWYTNDFFTKFWNPLYIFLLTSEGIENMRPNLKADLLSFIYDYHTRDHNGNRFPEYQKKAKQSLDRLYVFTYKGDSDDYSKLLAMFGSFLPDDYKSTDVYPYPFESVPDAATINSISFPLEECDPDGDYDDRCNLQWDFVKDGIPDTFASYESPDELKEAFQKFGKSLLIPEQTVYTQTPVVPIFEKNIALRALFEPVKVFKDDNRYYKVDFIGHLIAYPLSDNGTVDLENPLWDAGEKLVRVDPSERRIFIDIDGEMREFSEDNYNVVRLICRSIELSNRCDNTSSDVYKLTQRVVAYIRGRDFSGWRSRRVNSAGETWKLGAIIASRPVYHIYDDGRLVIWVGADDGMLHAFDENGNELWAYVPFATSGILQYLPKPWTIHVPVLNGPIYGPYKFDYDGDNKDELVLAIVSGYGGRASKVEIPTANGKDKPHITFLDVTNATNPKFIYAFRDLSYYFHGLIPVKKGKKYIFLAIAGDSNYYGERLYEDNPGLTVYAIDLTKREFELLYTGRYGDLDKIQINLNSNRNLKWAINLHITYNASLDINGDGNTDYVAVGLARFLQLSHYYYSLEGFGGYDKSVSFASGGILWLNVIGNDYNQWRGEIFWLIDNVTSIGDYTNNEDINASDGNDVLEDYVYNQDALLIPPIASGVTVGNCFGHYYLFLGTGRYLFYNDNPYNIYADWEGHTSGKALFQYANRGVNSALANANYTMPNYLMAIPLVYNATDQYCIEAENESECNRDTYQYCDKNHYDKCVPLVKLVNYKNRGLLCQLLEQNRPVGWFRPLDADNATLFREKTLVEPFVIEGYNSVLFGTSRPYNPREVCESDDGLKWYKTGGISYLYLLHCALGDYLTEEGLSCPGGKYAVNPFEGSVIVQTTSAEVSDVPFASLLNGRRQFKGLIMSLPPPIDLMGGKKKNGRLILWLEY